MPKMDGWQVAKTLRQRATPKRPLIIAISGYSDSAARLRSRQVGIDLHLAKPVDFNVLLQLLANHPVRTMPSVPRRTCPRYGSRPRHARSLLALADQGCISHFAEIVRTRKSRCEQLRRAIDEQVIRSEVLLTHSYQRLSDSQAYCRSVSSWLDRVRFAKRVSRCS
jgi:DNA-binding response OmpR family regulator